MQSGANRPRALAGRSPTELEGMFARGVPPEPPLDGRYDGALLQLTLGPGADFVFERLLGLWLPWLGKRFDAGSASGENVFDMSASPSMAGSGGDRLRGPRCRPAAPQRALRARAASGSLRPSLRRLRDGEAGGSR